MVAKTPSHARRGAPSSSPYRAVPQCGGSIGAQVSSDGPALPNSGISLGAAPTVRLARLSNLARPAAACALVTALAASAFAAQAPLPGVGGAAFPDAIVMDAGAALVAAGAETGSGPAATELAIALNAAAADLADVLAYRNTDEASRAGATRSEVPAASRGGTRMEVRTTVDPHERIEREDPNRFADLPPLTVQAGRDGEVTRVYQFDDDGANPSENGVVVLEVATSPRADHIVAIGTRERPAQQPFSGDMVTGGIPESTWVALAQCESGGNPSIISPGGRFHGLYQFSVATWNSVGGTGLPSQASPEEQRYRAVALQARSGWGQWPSCSRRIGVR